MFKIENSISPEESRAAGKLGILVHGYNRPEHLEAMLESLRLQDRIQDVHVWIDGTGGRGEFSDMNKSSIGVAQSFEIRELVAPWGHFGMQRFIIDSLHHMIKYYDRVLILEDDCFPLEHGIDEIEQELDAVKDNDQIFSVYGHHFLTEPSETRDFTRFQGWGWAAHREQIARILPKLRYLQSMNEADYLKWVSDRMNDDIREKLDRTPGRNVLGVLKLGYSWDSVISFLTAREGLLHRRTSRVTLANTGIVSGIGHFQQDNDRVRSPPLNMITVEECWDHYHQPSLS